VHVVFLRAVLLRAVLLRAVCDRKTAVEEPWILAVVREHWQLAAALARFQVAHYSCTNMHVYARNNMNTENLNLRPWLVLICGPYLSGTGGDAKKIAANRARLEAMALPIYERGHLPLIGEWLANPIAFAAGSRNHDDSIYAAHQYPVAQRLLRRCDAVLRIEGDSRGADLDVASALEMGLPVFTQVDQLPLLMRATP
jgi:hypothetical protein